MHCVLGVQEAVNCVGEFFRIVATVDNREDILVLDQFPRQRVPCRSGSVGGWKVQFYPSELLEQRVGVVYEFMHWRKTAGQLRRATEGGLCRGAREHRCAVLTA